MRARRDVDPELRRLDGCFKRDLSSADTCCMEQLLSVPEVAELLGVSRAQVYRLVEAGLPSVRLSERVLRFRPYDLEDWVAEQVVNSSRDLHVPRIAS